jgi:cell division protein FtsL
MIILLGMIDTAVGVAVGEHEVRLLATTSRHLLPLL